MDLRNIPDHELLTNASELAQSERLTVTKILHHLHEIERRKLYCDLGCGSLFEYAVKHLHYSEGQAGRRIQAMRVLADLPEIEDKVSSGVLSLSNLAQAQGFFRESAVFRSVGGRPVVVSREEKLDVLRRLEHKTARDGMRELISLGGIAAMPRERERVIDGGHSEVSFVMSDELRGKLDEVRSLLGPKGSGMGIAALIEELAEIGAVALRAKRFGKRRETPTPTPESGTLDKVEKPEESGRNKWALRESARRAPNPRYVPPALKHAVWHRDGGTCCNCGSRRGLNFDHIVPVARGGKATLDNLRLLCFACNQRAGIRAGLVPSRYWGRAVEVGREIRGRGRALPES